MNNKYLEKSITVVTRQNLSYRTKLMNVSHWRWQELKKAEVWCETLEREELLSRAITYSVAPSA